MNSDAGSVRTWVTGLVIGLAVLIGGAVLLAMPYSRKPVDDYIAKMKAAGKPVTMIEALGPDPAAESNGAPEFAAAGKWMDDNRGDPDTWKVIGPWSDSPNDNWYDVLTDAERRDLEAFLADAKPFFDGVASGLAKPRLRTPAPKGDGLLELGDDTAARVRVNQVLSARAQAASSPDDRLSAAEMLAKFAAHWESHGLIDEYLSAEAMSGVTTSIRLVVERSGTAAAVWRARLDGLLGEAWLPRFREGVRLERAFQLDFLRVVDVNNPVLSSRPVTWDKVLLQRITARLDAFRKGESTPQNSPADLVRAMVSTEQFETSPTESYPRLAAEIAAVTAAAPQGSSNESVVGWIARTAELLAKTDADCRLARIALAASEHRAKHGDFPSTLDELAWAFPDGVPLDPFTDAPFTYEKTSTGVRIASIPPSPKGHAWIDATLRDECLLWELRR